MCQGVGLASEEVMERKGEPLAWGSTALNSKVRLVKGHDQDTGRAVHVPASFLQSSVGGILVLVGGVRKRCLQGPSSWTPRLRLSRAVLLESDPLLAWLLNEGLGSTRPASLLGGKWHLIVRLSLLISFPIT